MTFTIMLFVLCEANPNISRWKKKGGSRKGLGEFRRLRALRFQTGHVPISIKYDTRVLSIDLAP